MDKFFGELDMIVWGIWMCQGWEARKKKNYTCGKK